MCDVTHVFIFVYIYNKLLIFFENFGDILIRFMSKNSGKSEKKKKKKKGHQKIFFGGLGKKLRSLGYILALLSKNQCSKV